MESKLNEKIIRLNSKLSETDIKILLSDYKYGRYCEDKSLDILQSREYIAGQIHQYAMRDDTQSIVAITSKDQICGVMLFRKSPWDSEIFGYNVAIIDYIIINKEDYEDKFEITRMFLETFSDWCKNDSIRFATVKIPTLDLPVIHAFEKFGYKFIENWIYNKFDLKRVDELPKPSYSLRPFNSSDLDIMLYYAKGAFTTQRFHADYHIPYEKAELLYEKWIRTAFNDSNQKILALDIDSKPVAYMIYYINDLSSSFKLKFAMWKMALLKPALKGKGIGTNFFNTLLHYHKNEGLDIIDSGLSNRNLLSFNTHNKLQFRIISTLLTFHKWFF